MIGPLYGDCLEGTLIELERPDGWRAPLSVDAWRRIRPGDESLLARCRGATLDVGSGPGRLAAALATRGIPVLAVDVTPQAVEMTRRQGALALQRDVFARLPGTGRWETILLVDGNIGIGGDAASLLARIAELLSPTGQALVEVEPPGRTGGAERMRLRCGTKVGPWFRWDRVDTDRIGTLATNAALVVGEMWVGGDRSFVALRRGYWRS